MICMPAYSLRKVVGSRAAVDCEAGHKRLPAKMVDSLHSALDQYQEGQLSRDAYRSVVNCFYRMRDHWDSACDEMEKAVLTIAQRQGLSAEQLVPVATEIVSEAEEDVQGIDYQQLVPAMLPHDYKGLMVLTHLLNCLTHGQLVRSISRSEA